ncbi:hypothetical protein FB45DRAFT_326448 [Roridomyces roridus]|uniref:Uncharacterized protein n=1 Tax=Roridomyces roridus TaxID=1738132 RepID=A0AAD7B4V1_9AGAR|nr:hypothetical protein FB45DRAFT_326448 [Roridomyces roridus]
MEPCITSFRCMQPSGLAANVTTSASLYRSLNRCKYRRRACFDTHHYKYSIITSLGVVKEISSNHYRFSYASPVLFDFSTHPSLSSTMSDTSRENFDLNVSACSDDDGSEIESPPPPPRQDKGKNKAKGQAPVLRLAPNALELPTLNEGPQAFQWNPHLVELTEELSREASQPQPSVGPSRRRSSKKPNAQGPPAPALIPDVFEQYMRTVQLNAMAQLMGGKVPPYYGGQWSAHGAPAAHYGWDPRAQEGTAEATAQIQVNKASTEKAAKTTKAPKATTAPKPAKAAKPEKNPKFRQPSLPKSTLQQVPEQKDVILLGKSFLIKYPWADPTHFQTRKPDLPEQSRQELFQQAANTAAEGKEPSSAFSSCVKI